MVTFHMLMKGVEEELMTVGQFCFSPQLALIWAPANST